MWRQLGLPVAVALVVFNLVFLLMYFLRLAPRVAGEGLGLADAGMLALFLLPSLGVFTIPTAVIAGVLLGMARMTEDGELVALRAAGVGPHRVAMVPLFIGLLASAATFACTNGLAPPAARRVRRLLAAVSTRNAAAALASGYFFEQLPGLAFLDGVWNDGNERRGFFAYDYRDDERLLAISASKVGVAAAPSGQLLLDLENGHAVGAEKGEEITSAVFSSGTIRIRIDELIADSMRILSPSAHLEDDQLREMMRDGDLPPQQRRQYQAAWHRRRASAVAAILFSLLGVFLVMPSWQVGRARALWLALAVVCSYYLLARAAELAGERGTMAVWLAVWLPNLLLLSLLIILWGRVAGVTR
ncbi:MAG: YjgP/YjgQ family permease [Deltaproteobacteria bacterium]|nr:MAG: YjgP/YjgQ family permease [Deltaproteobacteria bacterium]